MYVLYLFAGFFIVISLIPLTHNPHWLFRSWGYIRIQTLVIQTVLFVLMLVLGSFRESVGLLFTIALFATMVFQAYKVLPYTRLWPVKHKKPENQGSESSLKLLTANVLQDNDRKEDFIALVKHYDPDVVLMMESNKKWERAMETLMAVYPHAIKEPLDNYYGMHLYSKFALNDSKLEYRIEKGEVPSITATIPLKNGGKVRIYCVHPAPPSPTENETSKERDAELLIVGKEVEKETLPVIVCGDMNDVVWSRVSNLFTKMTGLIDPRKGRGLFATFHAEHRLLRFPLDHLFHSEDIYVKHMERGAYYGSDHFPMFFDIIVIPNKKPENDSELNGDEEGEVEERIEEGVKSEQKEKPESKE